MSDDTVRVAERVISAMSVPVELLAGVQRATAHSGWTVEQAVTWNGEACIFIQDGPVGRGRERYRFMITGPKGETVSDCLRVLATLLELPR